MFKYQYFLKILSWIPLENLVTKKTRPYYNIPYSAEYTRLPK